MGTNYYTRINECKHCKRFENIHLGKSSAGWQFSFQYNGGQYYQNIKEMKDFLKDKIIKDEYDHIVTHDKFWEMVESKQKNKLNHVDYMKKNHPNYSERDFKIDGYSFTDCDFS